MLNPKVGVILDYIAHITRGGDNVDTDTISANGDDEAFQAAKTGAASLGLAPDDHVVLHIKLPDGTFKMFLRKDF